MCVCDQIREKHLVRTPSGDRRHDKPPWTWWWTVSVGQYMQCNISLSSNIRICFSLPTERFKTLSISIIAHSSSWHLHPARHWQSFSVSFIAGSVLAGLCGTVWTYMCGFGIMLDNFNHSRCAAIFILHISERNMFSSVDCISYWELSPFVWLFTYQFNFSRVFLFKSSYYKLL